MLLTDEEHQAIQKAGANARALNEFSYLDNPYLQANFMPLVTGESGELWLEKYEAWRIGWLAEDAVRPDALSRVLSALA